MVYKNLYNIENGELIRELLFSIENLQHRLKHLENTIKNSDDESYDISNMWKVSKNRISYINSMMRHKELRNI